MKINPAFLFERVGHQVVVLDSTTQTVIAVSDDSARVLGDLRNGVEVSSDAPGMLELIDQGIVLSASTSQLSRRSLFVAGGAVGAGSVLALGLPAAAAASSPETTDSEVEPGPTAPKPPAPELDGGGGDGPEASEVDRLFSIRLLNGQSYDDLAETAFSWGFTVGGDRFPLAIDSQTPPQLEWTGGAIPIPEGARVGQNLTILVFAFAGGALSDPTEHIVDLDLDSD